MKLIIALLSVGTSLQVAAIDVIKDDAMTATAAAVSNIEISPDMMEKATQVVEVMNSDEWQQKLSAMRKMAALPLGLDIEKEERNAMNQAPTDRIYVFISASIPINTLRNYARDLARIPGGVMILRGFVKGGHTVKPTAKLVSDILKQDPFCKGATCPMLNVEVQIDPLLFRHYRIARVPAIAFAENTFINGYCGVDIKNMKPNTETVIFGDASLSYAIQMIYEGNKNEKLVPLLDTLNGDV